MTRTPLEPWISSKILGEPGPLTDEQIRGYQLDRLRSTLAYASERSPFYRRHLADYPADRLHRLDDLAAFPFTTAQHLVESGPEFLCLSQSEIERVVTLPSPRIAEAPRRLFFSTEDLELTIDFFHYGMSTMVRPGQKVLILMPGDRPASVGDLLVKALHRMDVEGIVRGVVQEPERAIRDIVGYEIDCLVGIPAQVFSIARHPRAREIPSGRIKSVLLSADHAPSAIIRELGRAWGCPVFNHYGTTEMGLGGGVECEALSGYHLREADLYFEIVDPDSGIPEPPGGVGEVVFTTLTRTGMPLIRYRTGDLARFEPERCPCGTVLRRMDTIAGRLRDKVRFRTGDRLGILELDEALFPLPGIMNYSAALSSGGEKDLLEIEIHPMPEGDMLNQASVKAALLSIPQIASAIGQGSLRLELSWSAAPRRVSTGVEKRAIGRSQLKEYHSG